MKTHGDKKQKEQYRCYATVGNRVEAVSEENPPGKRKIRKWRHDRVIIVLLAIFSNIK